MYDVLLVRKYIGSSSRLEQSDGRHRQRYREPESPQRVGRADASDTRPCDSERKTQAAPTSFKVPEGVAESVLFGLKATGEREVHRAGPPGLADKVDDEKRRANHPQGQL